MLFFDDQTETFWSQMTGVALVGPLTGQRLKWIPSEVTTWRDWKARHPKTTILVPPRPMRAYRDTNRGYARYRARDRINFPTGPNPIDGRRGAKAPVTILLHDGRARCYPHDALKEGENRDGDLLLRKRGTAVRAFDQAGKEVSTMSAFWFAWCVFYPEGAVYEPAPNGQR